MDRAMKLLVYSVASILLLSVLALVIFPMLFPTGNTLAIFGKNLEAAETGLGVGFTSEIEVKQGDGFGGETFDSLGRNIVFQCNNATLCCPQGKECDSVIEWDSKLIKFNKTKIISTTTRCDKEYEIYTCTIYFGERPAQIEIDSLKSPKEVDLGKEVPVFEISFSNTGGIKAIQTAVEIEVFRRYLEDGQWIEKRIESASTIENFGSLEVGKTSKQKIYLNLNENGLFKARVKASGLEAGFDEKIVEFNAIGANTECVASYCEEQSMVEENCITRCHCDSCLFGSNCSEKLLQADNITLGLIPEIDLKDGTQTVLGSNIIDFKVSEMYCQEIIPNPNTTIPDNTIPNPDNLDIYGNNPPSNPINNPADPSDVDS